MMKTFLKLLRWYIEIVGVIAAIVFFLLALPVMIFLKLSGQTIEKEF